MTSNLINSHKLVRITKEDIIHQLRLSCQTPAIIEKIIEQKIIISKAAEAGIEVTIEELQKAFDQIRALSHLKNAQDTWTWLEKYGLSLDDIEEIVYLNLVSRKLIYHLFANKIEPNFYEHQLDYANAVIYEITLDDEDEALKLYYEIQEDDISFFEAARRYIQDTELRRKGGYRGKVNSADMKPEVSAAVFAATASQLLKPIITADGIYLVLVEEIIKPELDKKLRHQIMLNLYTEWLKQQTKQVQVISNLAKNESEA